MDKQRIKCLATGNMLILTEEEKVRQAYIKALIEDYGYEKENIMIEYPVKRSPSDTRKSLPVDIAVLENGAPKIFIETKKPTVKEGIEQLKNYMDFENVKYGVWTNGSVEEDKVIIHYLKKIVLDGRVDYKDIFDIPEKGFYSVSEQLKKKDLKPTSNLKNIFKQIRGFIAANATGTTRDEKILTELMSILICKIYDERYKADEDYMDFIVIDGDSAKTAQKIKDIFNNKVKAKYPMVFSLTDKISLDENSITYVVAQLQKFSLTGTSHQVVSDAFESIISYASKGSQGQFFTPKNVIDLMVNILKPARFKYLIDPASGTAGFLTSAMNYVWREIDNSQMEEIAKAEEKKEYAMIQLFGIEKDDFLAKLSKSYMAILGDGKSGIFIEDSLNTKNWSNRAKAEIRDGYFDYILTNPPFGKDVKVQKETRGMYQFDPVEIIFLERCLQLVKDGGIIGIILPETVFHSPTNQKIREKLIYENNVICMIDLPHDTFRPFNNAKCNIIFIQKNRPQQDKILAINIENIGHNHLGQPLYLYDLETNTFNENILNDDIPHIINLINDNQFMSDIEKTFADGLDSTHENLLNKNEYARLIKYVKSSDVLQSDLLVARNYFMPKLNISNSVSLEQLINENILIYFDGHGSPKGHLKGLGEYPYIRVKDIVNLEVYINPLDLIPDFEYKRLYRDNKKLEEKDIVFVRRGSYRIGDVGILYDKDLNSILTREILVLRVVDKNNRYGITPLNLLYLLNSNEVKKQLSNKIMIDTTLPNIADRWRQLLVPIYSKEKMKEISDNMEELYNSRSDFWHKFNKMNK